MPVYKHIIKHVPVIKHVPIEVPKEVPVHMPMKHVPVYEQVEHQASQQLPEPQMQVQQEQTQYQDQHQQMQNQQMQEQQSQMNEQQTQMNNQDMQMQDHQMQNDNGLYQRIPVFQKEFPDGSEQESMSSDNSIDVHTSHQMEQSGQQWPTNQSNGGGQESRISMILSKLRLKPINIRQLPFNLNRILPNIRK